MLCNKLSYSLTQKITSSSTKKKKTNTIATKFSVCYFAFLSFKGEDTFSLYSNTLSTVYKQHTTMIAMTVKYLCRYPFITYSKFELLVFAEVFNFTVVTATLKSKIFIT